MWAFGLKIKWWKKLYMFICTKEAEKYSILIWCPLKRAYETFIIYSPLRGLFTIQLQAFIFFRTYWHSLYTENVLECKFTFSSCISINHESNRTVCELRKYYFSGMPDKLLQPTFNYHLVSRRQENFRSYKRYHRHK